MRLLKKFLFGLIVVLVIAVVGFTFLVRGRYVVPIIAYHSISPLDEFILNTVSPKSFERQMRFIKKMGYNVIAFDDLVEGIQKGHSFSRNTVVIQFDDGAKNNYTNAFPILKELQFPAMVFLISDKVGTPGYLTWDEVKEMEDYEFEAGAHTRMHPYLPPLKTEAKWDEIAGSKRIIEEHLGHKIYYFAYPSGGFDDEVKQMVKDAGYKAAVTTNRGQDKFNQHLFELNRIRIKDIDGGIVFWAKLSGYYNLFRKTKSGCGSDCNSLEKGVMINDKE